jgi:hypothetical protein
MRGSVGGLFWLSLPSYVLLSLLFSLAFIKLKFLSLSPQSAVLDDGFQREDGLDNSPTNIPADGE